MTQSTIPKSIEKSKISSFENHKKTAILLDEAKKTPCRCKP